jgi:hypothetical protein
MCNVGLIVFCLFSSVQTPVSPYSPNRAAAPTVEAPAPAIPVRPLIQPVSIAKPQAVEVAPIVPIAPTADATPPANLSRYGYHWQPAYSVDRQERQPLEAYNPQPGDIFLYSHTNTMWTTLYVIARAGAVPGHSGMVVKMANGELGILEAGYNDKPWTKTTPLVSRFDDYKGTIWIRKRITPLSEEQSCLISQFASQLEDRFYAVGRFALQLTQIRTRGYFRTAFMGKPKGLEGRYMCAECILEALVYAGLLPKETTRPSATFPIDMFYDASTIPYINKHLNLYNAGWEKPVLWTRDGTIKYVKPQPAYLNFLVPGGVP